MSNGFISANQARIKSDENCNKEILDELEGVFKEINKAVEKGSYFTYWYAFISAPSKSKLEELGYKVEDTFYRNEYEYTIKW